MVSPFNITSSIVNVSDFLLFANFNFFHPQISLLSSSILTFELITSIALISHNVLPKSFAPALALYVAIQATLMARARAMFEGKKLCEIRARGQKGKNKGKTTN